MSSRIPQVVTGVCVCLLTVPQPKISRSVPSLDAATMSGTVQANDIRNCREFWKRELYGRYSLVRSRSETTSFSGRPSRRFLPLSWSRSRDRIESRVTPGRIMSPKGGVTNSTAVGDRIRTRQSRAQRRGGRYESPLTAIRTSERDAEVHSAERERSSVFLPDRKNSHLDAPDLGQAVLRTKEPQNLLVTERSSLLLRDNTGSIVATKLVASRSTRPGADVLGGGVKLDGLEAGRVVRADGAGAAGGGSVSKSSAPRGLKD
jgi:hypothetical protein